MTKLRATFVGLSLLALVGCAAERAEDQATRPMNVDPIRIGAGDKLGMELTRTDHAIAGAEARDRALASHPED